MHGGGRLYPCRNVQKKINCSSLFLQFPDVQFSLDVAKDGRTCRIEWDSSKPNGTPRKLCDVTRLNNLGWKAKVEVRRRIEISYDDFLHGNVRK